ncbi:MAG: site-2 protease family protein [Ruminococcus sp.]|nr:site-2 protease family protein [Ruminococcus sp.]
MRLKINNFVISISFPALAVFSFFVINTNLSRFFLCLVSIVIHETGHLSAMMFLGLNPKGIEIKAFDIKIIENSRYNTSFSKDILITLSGPLFNIFAFLAFISFSKDFAYINLFIGIFNLLPATSLDGGQIVYLVLSKHLSTDKSAKITDIITIITALPLFFFGLLILLNSKYNFSMLFLGIYLFLTLFIRDEKYL